jgi:hypothetical protein
VWNETAKEEKDAILSLIRNLENTALKLCSYTQRIKGEMNE